MNAQNIKIKLDELSKLQEQAVIAEDTLAQSLVASYGTGVLGWLTKWRADIALIKEACTKLETEIKDAVLELNETVTASTLQAIPCKGKTSWDGKGLTGYAVAHPEINVFKKTGNPYAMIKTIKE
jgi:hypothetical protein